MLASAPSLSADQSMACHPILLPISTNTYVWRVAMAHGKWWAITSILFCVSLAHSQIPTPIRSVSSLPATCNGGSATKASDMVILVTAGVGTTYICNTPNHWISIAGSGGGNVDPGTALSQNPNWDPVNNKYVPQSKAIYDTRDWMVCDG